MGGARRRIKSPHVHSSKKLSKERDQETIRLVNAALDDGQIAEVRKLAAVRGLVNSQLRARAWPVLAGTGETLDEHWYLESSKAPHRDSSTVRVDVQRSLWTFADDSERPHRRVELERLLNAVVNMHEGDVFYYQGLHDIASVLLMVLGEPAAAPLLQRLAKVHLRDCTRATLDPALELLTLLHPLLAHLDPPLAAHLEDLGVPSFFALSWLLTWFSHTTDSLPEAARLFDLFLASHPLMPLYVGAAAMHSQRVRLLACTEMPELHSVLHNLPLTRLASVDQLAQQAIDLQKQVPPNTLPRCSRLRLAAAVTPEAQLTADMWTVPTRQPRSNGSPAGSTLAAVQHAAGRLLLRTAGPMGSKVVLTTALSLTSAVGLMLMLVRMQQQGMQWRDFTGM